MTETNNFLKAFEQIENKKPPQITPKKKLVAETNDFENVAKPIQKKQLPQVTPKTKPISNDFSNLSRPIVEHRPMNQAPPQEQNINQPIRNVDPYNNIANYNSPPVHHGQSQMRTSQSLNFQTNKKIQKQKSDDQCVVS